MRPRGFFVRAENHILPLLMCIIMAGCFSGCRKEATAVTDVPKKTKVIVQPVAQVTVKDTVMLSGELEADKKALLSFLVPGKVSSIQAFEGDHVEAGQVLSTVESDDYQSNLEITEAILLKAQNEYDMYQPIYQEGAFAEKDFIKIKTNLATSKAGRDIARKKVVDTKLKAPFSGTIGHKNIEIGQMVTPEITAFTVVKSDIIFARISVPESEIGNISEGQMAEIMIPALGDLVKSGEVTMIGPIADLRTRTYPVKVKLSNPENVLRTGMIVQARIITNSPVVTLTVPGNSIVRDADNLTYVFVADRIESRAHKHRVETGSVYRQEIEITSGLRPEDFVIVGGQNKLTDGSEILIIAPGNG